VITVRWLLIGLALAAPGHLLGADVYKWVDEEGAIHYGAAPPLGVDATRVRVSHGPGSPASRASDASDAEQAEQDADPAAGDAPAGEAGDQVNGVDPDEAARVCADARRNLQTLKTHGRVRERDAEGNVVVLTDEQKQDRINQAEELIETYCT
jgi:hypothetical protein